MLEAASKANSWIGVLWFGLFSAGGFLIAWKIRRDLTRGRIRGRGGPVDMKIAIVVFALAGACSLVLALRELLRAT